MNNSFELLKIFVDRIKESFFETPKKKKASFVFILIIISLIIGNALVKNTKSKNNTLVSNLNPSPIPYPDLFPESESQINYYLNSTNSFNNPIAYSWFNRQLVYATRKGIFKAYSNSPIIEASVDFINFNQKGQAVVYSNSKWYIFDSMDSEPKEIDIKPFQAFINATGDKILTLGQNKIAIYSTDTKSEKSIDIPNMVPTKIGWIYQTDSFYISHIDNDGITSISIYNSNLEKQTEKKLSINDKLMDINSSGDKILLKRGNSLGIFNIETNHIILFEFKNENSYDGYWITPNTALVFETTVPNKFGQYANIIWTLKENGERKALADTNPIPGKVNPKIKPLVDNNTNVLAFVENTKGIWLFSLTANKFPYLNTDGTIGLYSGIIKSNQEDDHGQ